MTAAELQAFHRGPADGPPGPEPGPGVAEGAIAIRVRRSGYVDRLITEDAPAPGAFPMDICADSLSGHGRAPRTFALREDAEAERVRWERAYGFGAYRFDLVERVLTPQWRAVGGEV